MKIVVVHQHYLMPDQPGGSRFNEFTRLWSEAGHEVTVIAGNLNYVTGDIPAAYRGRWVMREQNKSVTVWRCHVPSSYSKSSPGRMFAFFGFTLSALTAAVKVKNADIVVATSPPLVAAIPGWAVARLRRRVPLIFEIRDLWPETAITTGVLRPDTMLTKLLYGLERWACRSADCVNVLTPAFKDDIVRRGLAGHEKVAFIPNGADVELFSPGRRDNNVRREFGWGERFVVLYAGAHGRANAVKQLLEAAERLKHRTDVLIATVGDGPERANLEKEARQRKLDNVMFCGAQAKDRMPEFINACDVGAAVLQNNPTFKTVYPNKVFDYMACARPTLLAIDGVARKLVCDEARAGVFAEPENAGALACAIERLADDPQKCVEMGQRGRAWVLAHATRESLAARYIELMEELVAVKRSKAKPGEEELSILDSH
ncbi:MAG: glycosyltransferase family 4 protein [Pyrinomonadaceae bacterium]